MAVLIIVSVVIGAALFLGGLLTMQGADGPDRSAGFKTGLSMKDQESWSFANRLTHSSGLNFASLMHQHVIMP